MSRKSQSSQSQHADESPAPAEEETSSQHSPYDGAQELAEAYNSPEPGTRPTIDTSADDKHLLIAQLVGGVRFIVKDGETPGVIALRVVETAEKIYRLAVERGFLQASSDA